MTHEMAEAWVNSIFEELTMENAIEKLDKLKQVGILAQGIRIERKADYIEYIGIPLRTTDEIRHMISNVYQKMIKAEKELTDMRRVIPIGCEFTFRNDNFVFSLDDLKSGMTAQKEKIELASQEIAAWTVDIEANAKRFKTSKDISITVKINDGRKKHGSEYYNAKSVDFVFYNKITNETERWSVNFDLDPNCIEVQASPVPYTFYERYKDIIEFFLFQRKSCKPEVNPDIGGGGHISLGFAEAFQGEPYYLLNFIKMYNDSTALTSVKNSHLLTCCSDVINAPFLYEIQEEESFQQLVRTFNSLPKEQAVMQEFVRRMCSKVYTKVYDTSISIKDAAHYQAINLEHLDSNTPESEKRVEMRRFNAQTNITELLQELDGLYELIQSTRWLVEITKEDMIHFIQENKGYA